MTATQVIRYQVPGLARVNWTVRGLGQLRHVLVSNNSYHGAEKNVEISR